MTQDCHIYIEYAGTHQLGKILIHQTLYSTPPRPTLHDHINTDDCREDREEREDRGGEKMEDRGEEEWDRKKRSEGEGRENGRKGYRGEKGRGLIDAWTLNKRCTLVALAVVQ